MSLQGDLQQIKSVVTGLENNPVARLAYTQSAFDADNVDGVANFNNSAEQNIPLATKTDFNPTVLTKGIRGDCASYPRNAWNHYLGRMSYNLNKLVQKIGALITVLLSMLSKGGFRYDNQATYSTGSICYDIDSNNIITWYKRNSTYSNGPVPLTDTYWDELADKVSLEAVVANVENSLTSISTTMALSAAKGKELQDTKAPINTILMDAAESNTLPNTSNTALTALLQTMRNNIKHLFNNKANKTEGVSSGTVGTAISTAVKTATVDNFMYAESNNKLLILTFTNGNSAAATKLNINSQGDKDIWYKGALTSTTNPWVSPAGSSVLLQYDTANNRFNIIDDGLDSNRISSAITTTSISTATKVVSVPNFILSRSSGKLLALTFTYGNSAAVPVLNVNTQGAKPIWINGAVTSSSNLLTLVANATVFFQYDLTNDRFNVVSIVDGSAYGLVRFPVIATTSNVAKSALPYTYFGASTEVHLNNYREAGEFTFYNISSSSTGFPAGFGTGTANSASLKVILFYGDTAGLQILRKRGTRQKWERIFTAASTFTAWELVSGSEVGDVYIQYPNTREPGQKWPSENWVDWTERVEFYEVSTSVPAYTTYAANQSYNVGVYVLYTHKDKSQEIFKCKNAIASAPAVLDPVNWTPLRDDTNANYVTTCVERISIQATWGATASTDLAIGVTISGAPVSTYNGKRITGRYTPGGKFAGFAGGNRPPYINGGVAPDVQRAITGAAQWLYMGYPAWGTNVREGAFSFGAALGSLAGETVGTAVSDYQGSLRFNSADSVLTSPENSPRTMSVRYWRRVA